MQLFVRSTGLVFACTLLLSVWGGGCCSAGWREGDKGLWQSNFSVMQRENSSGSCCELESVSKRHLIFLGVLLPKNGLHLFPQTAGFRVGGWRGALQGCMGIEASFLHMVFYLCCFTKDIPCCYCDPFVVRLLWSCRTVSHLFWKKLHSGHKTAVK